MGKRKERSISSGAVPEGVPQDVPEGIRVQWAVIKKHQESIQGFESGIRELQKQINSEYQAIGEARKRIEACRREQEVEKEAQRQKQVRFEPAVHNGSTTEEDTEEEEGHAVVTTRKVAQLSAKPPSTNGNSNKTVQRNQSKYANAMSSTAYQGISIGPQPAFSTQGQQEVAWPMYYPEFYGEAQHPEYGIRSEPTATSTPYVHPFPKWQ